MLVQHPSLPFVMTHAGIAPMWTIEKAAKLAREVESVLRAETVTNEFYEKMYGNQPDYGAMIDRYGSLSLYY